jgi:hypothetical protein
MTKRLYGGKLELHAEYFDKVMGTARVREAMQRWEGYREITAAFENGINEFEKTRAPFLLYS